MRRRDFLLAPAALFEQGAFAGLRDAAAGVEALIAPEHGGELTSLRLLHRGRWVELLYRAADYRPAEGWRGKAPLLWPATGRSYAAGHPDGGYLLDGRYYPMPMHGFVSGLPWKMEERGSPASGAFVTVARADSPETRKYYPFGFRLTATYRLTGGKLEILYTVAAARANPRPMPFSIGNHISFRVPFLGSGSGHDMRFHTPASVEIEKTPDRLPNGKTRPWVIQTPVRLADLPAESAVSLTGYSTQEPWATLEDPQGLGIRLSHQADSIPPQPCILFNVWQDAARRCFCPEPWVGLQNSLNLRQGLVHLPPNAEYRWTIRLERLPASAG